ncbi:hypothetical protein DAI92_004983 [Salmonella enterica subsp. enterica serovar Bredeney]|nr:hypothetical protein [Salmonella enterica subsp. enterica serovar Bredeney]
MFIYILFRGVNKRRGIVLTMFCRVINPALQLYSFTALQLYSFTALQLYSFTALQLYSFIAL